MKHCSKCGAQLADDDDYCYFCGSSLEEKKETIYTDNSNTSNTYDPTRRNTLAMVGLVIAFFSPMVGLIISIIALNISNRMGGAGRGNAIAGIIVAIFNFVFSIIFVIIIFGMYGGEV